MTMVRTAPIQEFHSPLRHLYAPDITQRLFWRGSALFGIKLGGL